MTKFPAPLLEAIEAGVLDETDAEPANLASLHAAHEAALARDRHPEERHCGVDPATGKVPRNLAKQAELPSKLSRKIARPDRWWVTLLDTYAEAFGDRAATAFSQHVTLASPTVRLGR